MPKLHRFRIYLKQMVMMIQDTLVYRVNFIVRYGNWMIRFFVIAFLWTSVFAAKTGDIAGFSLQDTLTYFLILQVVSSLSFSRAGFQIASDIQSGDLSNKIILPANYLFLKMSQDFGKNLFFFVSHIFIYGLIAYFFRDWLTLDFNLLHLFISLPFLLVSYTIAFSLISIIGMLAFWFSASTRLIFVYFAIHSLISGFIIPLNFFPEKIQQILSWTPFPYNYYFITNLIQSPSWTPALTFGAIMALSYAIILTLLTHLIFKLGMLKYEAVGK
jgi:ABC-2 type transport system permease protein